MDQSILIQAGASATTISIIFILGWIYKTVNHRRIRSRCCGVDLDASVDIESTTPKEKETIEVINPKPTIV
jgi:hypothetical protein